MKVKIDEGAYMPTRAHGTDAGLDLRTKASVKVPARGSAVIDTGVHIELPHGWYGKIEGKSGLNVKHGVVSLGGITASGTRAEVGRTIATGREFDFGTRLYIEGIGERTVEDRGVGNGCIDVFCADHPECYALTGWYDVYLVEGE